MGVETPHDFPTMDAVMEQAQHDFLLPSEDTLATLSSMEQDESLRMILLSPGTFRLARTAVFAYLGEKYPDGYDSAEIDDKYLIGFERRINKGEPLGGMPAVGRRPSQYAIRATGPECAAAFWFVRNQLEDSEKFKNRHAGIDLLKSKLLEYPNAPTVRPRQIEDTFNRGKKIARGLKKSLKKKLS